MRALVIRTNGNYSVENVETGLNSMRKIVGGDVESFLLDTNGKMKIYINEAGKIYGLEANKLATAILISFFRDEDYVAGDVLICGVNSRGFDCSLTNAQIKELKVRKLIGSCILDPDETLTSKGDKEGNYVFRLTNNDLGFDEPFYSGQIGEDSDAPEYCGKTIKARVIQHLSRWIGNGQEKYWLGVDIEADPQWKLVINLLAEEKDKYKRQTAETAYIMRYKPISQDTAGGMFTLYPNTNYSRNDLCISPWHGQREKALKHRMAILHKTSSVE